MNNMTLDEAIDNFEREIVEFEGLKKIRAVTPEDYAKIDRTRQFVEWLKDYKKLKEQEPSEDAISRQAVLEYIEGSEAELGHSSENELVCQYIKDLPPVTPLNSQNND